jgi:hypothetical protein
MYSAFLVLTLNIPTRHVEKQVWESACVSSLFLYC